MRRPMPRLRELAGTEPGRKVLRYSLASVVNVLIGEAILAIGFGVFHWSARSAAIAAAVLAAFPAYWLTRRWVWGKSGRSHLLKEVVPFWAMALLGLVLTTWAAGVAERVGADMGLSRLGQTVLLMAAVLGVSGLFWVARFVVLNKVLFADRRSGSLSASMR